ncbi:MAG: branched-chain amino acid ABC transporter permease [Candidatus Bathyarchaeota archaeon]
MSVALLMNTLIYASMLVLMAQAHTLTYLTSDTFNLTIGPTAAIGAYTGFTVARVLRAQVYLSLPAAFTVCGLTGALCCALVVEPLLRRRRGPVYVTLALIAAGIILSTLVECYSYWLMTHFGAYAQYFSLPNYDFTVGWVPGVFIVSTVIAVVSVLFHERLLKGTIIGASLKAVADDADLAMVQGVNPSRVRWRAWALAGGLAGLAGAYGSIWFVWPQAMGTTLMTGVLASCLLGGVRSMRGAAVGGLIMGVVEITLIVWANHTIGVWMGEYRPLVPIAVMTLTMYFKPQGLLGQPVT